MLGVASPPIVARGVVVTPTIVSDFAIQKEAPPGWLKGIDARTGDTKWVFRTVPRGDDFGADTWLNESWRYSGNANVWPPMSADAETGYIYLPIAARRGDLSAFWDHYQEVLGKSADEGTLRIEPNERSETLFKIVRYMRGVWYAPCQRVRCCTYHEAQPLSDFV